MATYNNNSRQKLMLAGQIEKLFKGLHQFLPFTWNANNGISRLNANGYDVGRDAFAEGRTAHATGEGSHAEGYETSAAGMYAHAEGNQTEAAGDSCHAEGTETIATNGSSHAEGYRSKAMMYSHAEGANTRAYGNSSHAEGYGSYASGESAHAEGYYSEASGDYSHAEGVGTIAAASEQHVSGRYNIADEGEEYAIIVGDGLDDEHRHNIMTLDKVGNMDIHGTMYVGGCQSNGDASYPVMRYNVARNTPEYSTDAGNTWSMATPEGFIYGGAKVWTNQVTSREITVFTKNEFMELFHVKTVDEVDDCYCNFVNGDAVNQQHRIIATDYRSSGGWSMYLDSAASIGSFRVCYLVFVPKAHSSI